MPNTVSLYILRRVLLYLLAMTGVALAALLLERTLRVAGLVASWNGAVGIVFRMLLNLVPHYLGMALPAAFFFGVLLTFNRLSQSSELAALQASGLSLQRLVRPVLAVAMLLTLIAALTFGLLQPYGRYAYRALAHTIANVSLGVVVQAGKFIHVDGFTFLAESVLPGTLGLRKVFVYEERNGRSATTTASEGTVVATGDGQGTVLILRDGVRSEIGEDGRPGGTLDFSEYRWPIEMKGDWTFRSRGKDAEELTLMELWDKRTEGVPRASAAEIRAELDFRLVQILSVLFLPFLAMPLGLGGNRTGRAMGVGVGLVILVLYQQLLQFARAMTGLGLLPFWLAFWLPFLVFALGSLALFLRTSRGVGTDPLGAASGHMDEMIRRIRRSMPRLGSSRSWQSRG